MIYNMKKLFLTQKNYDLDRTIPFYLCNSYKKNK